MTASQKILRKTLVAADIPSAQWNLVDAQLRDRAFFSARVTSLKFLHAARETVAERAGERLSESEIRRELRRILRGEGYSPADGDAGTIKDLYTKARLDLVIRTNTQQARGWVQHIAANTPGAFAAFPAQELVRVRGRRKPRDWEARWRAAGGKFFGRRMVALKDDPVWTAISAFGQPYPPFDFNSGMGVRDVARREAIELGLVDADALKEKVRERAAAADSDSGPARGDVSPRLNDTLQAEAPFVRSDSPYAKMLERDFGNQIEIKNGVVSWRSRLMEDVLDGKVGKARLGAASDDLKASLEESLPEDMAKRLSAMDPSFSRTLFDDHISKHFGDNERRLKTNIPLTRGDIAMLPHVWRKPDRVIRVKKHDVVLEAETIDGGYLQLSVNEINGMTSFYKTKKPLEATSEMHSSPQREG